MNKIIISFLLFALISCNSYQRIGNLTMISTRNVDSKEDYTLISKGVEATAKMKNDDALQQAIDNAVAKFPEGEFMKNVSIYVKENGKKVKVVGDVWGISKVDKNITTKVSANIEFKVDDVVIFKNKNDKLVEGKIIGINSSTAIVEYKNALGKTLKDEFSFDKLTKH